MRWRAATLLCLTTVMSCRDPVAPNDALDAGPSVDRSAREDLAPVDISPVDRGDPDVALDAGPSLDRGAANDLGADAGPSLDQGVDVPTLDTPVDRGQSIDQPTPLDMPMAGDSGNDVPTVDVQPVDVPPRDNGPLADVGPAGYAGVGEGMSPDAIPERRVRCNNDPARAPTVTPGAADRYVLRGRVVTPTGVLSPGEVLVTNGLLSCVAASCAARTGYAGATVIETQGIIHPGLINAHDHPQYDWMPPWPPPRRFTNSGQWQSVAEYRSFTQPLRDNEGMYTCEMVKWGELRALVAGTTTLQGAPNRICVTRTLVRNIEYGNDFGGVDTHRPNTLGIATVNATDAMGLRADMDTGALTAYLLHLSEGIDETSRREFDLMVQRNLLAPAMVVIHGTAFRAAEFMAYGAARAKLIWSPRSNIILYGRTTDAAAARDAGINIALATDWTPSGGPNLQGELRYARNLSRAVFNNRFTARELVEMTTARAAEVIDRPQIGALVEGRYADLVVIPDTGCDAYDAIIDVPTSDIRLVMIGGRPRYGEAALFDALPEAARARCEAVTFCGAAKRICVAEAATTDLLNQTLVDIETNLRRFSTPYPLVPLCP